MRNRCQCAFQQPITWVGLSRSTCDKWANNWTPLVQLKRVCQWKQPGKVYFTRQSAEDSINMRREVLEAFGAASAKEGKKQGAAVMTETTREQSRVKGWFTLRPSRSRLAGSNNVSLYDEFFHYWWSKSRTCMSNRWMCTKFNWNPSVSRCNPGKKTICLPSNQQGLKTTWVEVKSNRRNVLARTGFWLQLDNVKMQSSLSGFLALR